MSYLYSGTIRNAQGQAQVGAAVTVYTDAAGTITASLTDSGGTPIANPATTDSRGRVEVYSTSPTLWYKVTGDTSVMRLVRLCDLTQGTVSGLPFYNATDYGATGDGATDDTDAIKDAITAAATGGGTVMFAAGTYKVSEVIVVPTGVNLWGAGKDCADPPLGTAFLCADASSGLAFGTRTGGTTGGVSGNFSIDGGGVASTGLYVGMCVERTFEAINVWDCVVGILIEAAQNNCFIGVNANNCATICMVLDYGAGGNLFSRCNLNDFGTCALHVKQSGVSPTGAYDYPSHNEWQHGVFERPKAAATSIVRQEAGGENCLVNCILADNGNLAANPLINLAPDATHDSARFQMFGGHLFGWSPHAGSGVSVGAASASFAHVQFIHLVSAFVGLVGNSVVEVDDIYLNSVDAWSDNLGSAAATIKKRVGSPLELSAKQAADPAILSLVTGDTGYRFEIDGAGIMYWGSGAAPVDVALYRAAAGLLHTDHMVRVGGGVVTKVKAGIPADGDLGNAVDGTLVLDSTNHRLYVRDGGAWKYAALT
jgi:hypothetical protein